ncbi:MAG: TIM-barrel domain-containing protein [Verrucomicrobiota bacterium]
MSKHERRQAMFTKEIDGKTMKRCPLGAGGPSGIESPASRRIRKGFQFASIFLAIFLMAGSGYARAAGTSLYQKSDNGILVKIGQAQVELAPATPATFRLSVSYDSKAGPAPSIFLADNSRRVAWRLARSGDFVGIKTSAGELLINPVTRQWTLKDPAGKILVPASPIGDLAGNPGPSPSHVTVTVGWDPTRLPAFYGSGNGMGQEVGAELPTIIGAELLQQTNGHSHLGNGVAVIPYYWSTAGYAALAVTGDDNKPAGWTSVPSQGCVTWDFPGRTADLYLMPAASLRDAAKAYAQLTGYAPVPPRWAFGYQQSRWGWTNRAYIEDALQQFISRKLPIDTFIFDVEWYTPVIDYSIPDAGSPDFKDFSWNPVLFPDPAAQIAAYKAQGVYSVAIRKPRLGNSELLQMIREKHWDLPDWRSINGMLASRMLNYRDPVVRTWYADQLAPLLACGIDGWWNDEGEATYTTYHYWVLAEQEAQTKFKPGMRLWTLNRAFAPGLQRLGAAAWTGDVEANWPQLERNATDLLNWSLAGMPYSACDIGGFRGETTPELLTRWMQAGVFFPVMRAHSRISVQAHFPWLFGPAAEDAIRKALDLRYRLIPYYYSLAYETHNTGVPLMQPLVMEFPQDPNVANLSDQWLMGDGLMVAPMLTTNDQRSVYLPAGDWYELGSNARLNGSRILVATAQLDQIPVYVHAGTILPLGPVIQHTDQLPGGPLELQVYPGKNSTFTLTEDDGETTAYLKNQFRQTTFTWNDATHRLGWKIRGPYHGKDIFTTMNIEVFYPEGIKQATASIHSSGSLQLPP